MAVTLVNSSVVTPAANTNTQSRSITVSAGADYFTYLAAFDDAASDISTAVWNGDSLTPCTGTATGPTSDCNLEIWHLVAPDVTTGTWAVTMTATTDYIWSGFATWAGVDQTTPQSDAITGGSNVTVVNVGADDVAVALLMDSYINTSTSFTPNRTEIWENKVSTGQLINAQYEATATGSVLMSTSAGTAIRATGMRIRAASLAASAALDGSLSSGAEASDIVGGGNTITLTLTNDTWVTAGGTFDAIRDDIIAGMDSNQAEAAGWDAVVKVGGLSVTDVVRTSPTLVTITFPAIASYSITLTELITVTIPAVALTGNVAVVASPTFTIVTGEATSGGRGAVNSGLLNRGLVGSGLVGA